MQKIRKELVPHMELCAKTLFETKTPILHYLSYPKIDPARQTKSIPTQPYQPPKRTQNNNFSFFPFFHSFITQ
jgi:hypothetical protein